jgi:hypothetical protein
LLQTGWQPIALGYEFEIQSVSEGPPSPAALLNRTVYSNLSNSTDFAHDSNGAANVGGNTITRMNADDIVAIPGFAGLSVTEFSCLVGNPADTPATARVDIFIYDSTGPNGLPGATLGVFPRQDITFNAHQSFRLTLSDAGPLFTLPSGRFWAGVAFDDRFGTIAVTAAQLNRLGMIFVHPPDIGASGDFFFATDSAGVSPNVNPAGGFYYFEGDPIANFGWEFVVPEPSAASLTAMCCWLALTSRRPTHRGQKEPPRDRCSMRRD